MSLVSMDAVVIVAFAAVLVVLAMILLRSTAARETQQVRRTLECPVTHETAECELVRDVTTGRLTSVARCSLQSPLRCGRECVKLLELGAALEPQAGEPRPGGAGPLTRA